MNPSPNPQATLPTSNKPPLLITKRKRSVDGGRELRPSKSAKLKKGKRKKPGEYESLDLEQLNLAFGELDSRLLADYVAQRTKYFSSELNLVELEDRAIPGRSSANKPKGYSSTLLPC